MKRTPLIISIAISTLILITLGGVISVVQGKGDSNNSMNAAEIDTAVEKAVTERDAAYRELIDQANQRILEAQEQNQELQEQLDELQVASDDLQVDPVEESESVQSAPVQTVLVTPEQAAQLAADQLSETEIYSVESGNSNGVAVYKVTFSSGTVALVSMEGEILVVQLPAPVVSSSSSGASASSISSGEAYSDDEDDDEGDDDAYEDYEEDEQEVEQEEDEEEDEAEEEDEKEQEEDEGSEDEEDDDGDEND